MRSAAPSVLDGPALAAAAAGLAWLALHAGVGVLDPTRVGWLMHGDWSASYLGWAFYRLAPYGLPLGANPGFPLGVGSSLAYTDSIPIAGVLLRPLAPLLPRDFQYLGPWLGLCFALQGFVGAKLVKLATGERIPQALGGALFALAPPLLHRVLGPHTGHASLSAHWIVLAFLWLALAPVEPGRAARRIGAAAALVLLATGVHPYHAVAGVLVSGALLARLWFVDREIGWTGAAAGAAAVAAAAALGALAFGVLAPGVATSASGFGYFSADGLALVNPMGWSRWWSGWAIGRGQYEGFGYLGGGALALAAAALASALRGRSRLALCRWRAAVPVAAVAVLLAALSLSDTITAAGTRVAHVPIYGWLPALGGTFRSSGRFLWSLHYLVLAGAIAVVAASWRDRPRVVALALGFALAAQVADVRPPGPPPDAGASPRTGASEAWSAALGRYRHVALVPPVLGDGDGAAAPGCPILFEPEAYVRAADAAYRLSATLNSGCIARMDPARAAAACAAAEASIAPGRLDRATVYVVAPRYRSRFRTAKAICGTVDGLFACVRGDARDPFAAALRTRPAE